MSKIVKSQWDFGELFPPQETRKVLSVAELTGQVRRLLEKQIGQVWVTGEITNFRAQSSGHIYFTLKDAYAQLSCVLFKGEAVEGRTALSDGQKVVLRGEVTVYESRGQYQLRVTAVELQGVGALQVAFEKLKQKLQAEGLFAPERKRPLPRYPQRIGLVTSPTGAAIRDVLHVIERRNPALEIILAPCSVQGQAAAYEIAGAIRLLNEWASRKVQVTEERVGEDELFPSLPSPVPVQSNKLDLILVTRGGGSLEDLWAFNEEVVARAIFNSVIPVVSAVGHEIDFTISDFVADFRAATPSVAAEIITEGVFSACKAIAETSEWMQQRVRQRVDGERRHLRQLTQRLALAHPRRRLDEKLQRLDDLQASLFRCVKYDWQKQFIAWKYLRERLARVRPSQFLKQRRELLEQEELRLREQWRHQLENMRNRYVSLETRLRLLSPEQVLSRGYSITMDAGTGKVIRSAEEVRKGQKLKTKLKEGEIRSTAEEK